MSCIGSSGGFPTQTLEPLQSFISKGQGQQLGFLASSRCSCCWPWSHTLRTTTLGHGSKEDLGHLPLYVTTPGPRGPQGVQLEPHSVLCDRVAWASLQQAAPSQPGRHPSCGAPWQRLPCPLSGLCPWLGGQAHRSSSQQGTRHTHSPIAPPAVCLGGTPLPLCPHFLGQHVPSPVLHSQPPCPHPPAHAPEAPTQVP